MIAFVKSEQDDFPPKSPVLYFPSAMTPITAFWIYITADLSWQSITEGFVILTKWHVPWWPDLLLFKHSINSEGQTQIRISWAKSILHKKENLFYGMHDLMQWSSTFWILSLWNSIFSHYIFEVYSSIKIVGSDLSAVQIRWIEGL